MLNYRIQVLIVILTIFSQLGFSQDVGSIDKGWMKDLIHNESKAFTKKHQINSSHTSNYDIKFHRLKFNIDPEVFYISGEITTYFVPGVELANIKFDFTDVLRVDEVLYNGENLEFIQSNNILTCTFKSALAEGKLDSIKVSYSGKPDPNIDAITHRYHNLVPIISTLSEPYGAKDWWPCKQDLIDKIDSIEVVVETPKKYRAVSNGLMIGEPIIGDKRVTTWRHKYPIPAYLIAIAITNYEDFTIYYKNIEGNDLPILNHIYPEDLELAKSSIEYTKDVLKVYEDLFEIYPYSKERYGHAQFPWGGGMEHATVSFMGNFSNDLIAHELAHQWFGDKITCGSWSDIWLNEGFATYLTGLTYENRGVFDEWLESKINHVTGSLGGSVYVTDTTSVRTIFSSRLSYSKGAMVLHMLRWKMGDDDFFTAIKNYLKDDGLKYSYAKTEDLKSHCEAVLSLDLTKFFNQWIYKEGYPSYAVEWKQNEDNSLSLLINQSQSHSSVAFFEMPVEIVINGEDGQKLPFKIDVNHNNFKDNVSVDFKISSIEFDPNKWLISKDNTVVLNPNLANDNFDNVQWSVKVKEELILISTTDNSIKSVTAKLYDTSGRLIISDSVKGSNNFVLHTNSLKKGVYYLVLDTGSKIISRTLLK